MSTISWLPIAVSLGIGLALGAVVAALTTGWLSTRQARAQREHDLTVRREQMRHERDLRRLELRHESTQRRTDRLRDDVAQLISCVLAVTELSTVSDQEEFVRQWREADRALRAARERLLLDPMSATLAAEVKEAVEALSRHAMLRRHSDQEVYRIRRLADRKGLQSAIDASSRQSALIRQTGEELIDRVRGELVKLGNVN